MGNELHEINRGHIKESITITTFTCQFCHSGLSRILLFSERFPTSGNDRCGFTYGLISKFLVRSLCLLLFALCTVGCAFPRIVILDDPLSPEEHINLGVAYEKQGELDNALNEYKKASEEIPIAYLYMGNIYLKKNDYENAEVSYKKAIKKDTQNADARNNLAWLYYLTKENLDKAENLALEAIALNPAKKDVYQDTLDKIRGLKKDPKAEQFIIK